MPSGFKTGGTDLDDVFAPYEEGTKPAATGYAVAGADLKERYAPISFGTAAPATGMKIVGGADLNTLWAAQGTAVYAGPVAPGFAAEYDNTRVSSHDAAAQVVLTIKSDGTWAVNSGGVGGMVTGTPSSGTWHSNPAPGVGTGARVRFASGGAWYDLATDRSVSVSASATTGTGGTTDDYQSQSYPISISKSDGSQQVDVVTVLTAQASVT